MRHQSIEYLQAHLDKWGIPDSILDVGSMAIDGDKTIKGLFNNKYYVGTDMRAGPNVDIVVNAHHLTDKFEPESFDMVVCFDTFEHDDKFWETLESMRSVVKPGGWLIMGVPSRRTPFHEHPSDYWRFMGPSMDLFFEGYEEYSKIVEVDNDQDGVENEIYGSGRKPL